MSDLAEPIAAAPLAPVQGTAQELFPAGPTEATAAELFPAPKTFVGSKPLNEYFQRGFKQGFQPEKPFGLQEKDLNWLRNAGVLPELEKKQKNILDQINESLIIGVPAAADFVLRSVMGTIYGVSEQMVATGVPRDLTPAAYFEAFPLGHMTPGYPGAARPRGPQLVDLDNAERLGLTGARPRDVAREAFSPDNAAVRLEDVPAAAQAEAPTAVVAPDVHTVARQLDPPTFDKYDVLAERKETLRQMLEEHAIARAATPRAVQLQGEIDTILGRVRGVEERLTNRASNRLDAARDELYELTHTDTPEMATVRKDLLSTDVEMRDLAPTVSEAYREARKILPEPVQEVVPQPAAEVVPLRPGNLRVAAQTAEGNTILGNRGQTHADLIDKIPEDVVSVKMGFADEAGNFLTREEAAALLPKLAEPGFGPGSAPWLEGVALREAQLRPQTTPVELNRPQIQSLAQRLPSIARDTERRLINAGRPAGEARAAGALVQAHYQARAERLGRDARDLYEAEAPRIVGGRGNARGRMILRDARNTIQLFERADASTFLHESAHNWLEELRRDGQEAPAVAADLDIVKEWVGAEGDTFTRAQHEKFARGFERYVMEGQAPTARLARVFEQFRQWLTQIYQTVARLRAPITDDIRGVYDRLLSSPPTEPVITAERPGSLTFAEEHAVAARETPIADAAAKADQMRAERDQVAAQLQEQLDARRREARRGPERVSVPTERERAAAAESAGAGDGGATERERPQRAGVTGETQAPASGQAAFDGVGNRLVDPAGNIRVENLNVPEDVGAAIREVAGLEGGFLDARRGVLSDVEVLELADDLGTDPKSLDRRAVGEAFNAEQIVAARRLLVQQATKVRDAAARAASLEGRLTGGEKAIVEYAVERERLVMIQEQVAGITAEAGRALRAFRQLDGLTDARDITSFLQQTMNTSPEALRREAILLQKLKTPQQLNQALDKVRKPGWQDMVVEAYINNLLSGPFTHVVNTTSNATVSFYSVGETAFAAGVGRLTGSRAVEFAEVGDRFYGIAQGSVDGLRAAADIVMDETKIPMARQVEGRVSRAIPSVNIAGINVPLGGAVRFPGRLLAAEDQFFKAIAIQQELNVLARRAARVEGLEGDAQNARIAELIKNPTDSMVAAAQQFAEYQTFQQQLGPTGRAVIAFADSHPMFRFIIPFIRTPVNIFKYSLERTPFGLLQEQTRTNLSGANGAIARDTQIARMAMGTMLGIGVGYLALQGFMSGGGPVKAAEQETMRLTGWQPYSARLGDTWFSFRRFDPLANILGLAADFADLGQYVATNDDEYAKLGTMVMMTIWRNLGDKLSLRGVSSLVQAVTDYEQHGRQFITGLVGSLVPGTGLLGQIASIEDPFVRETRANLDTFKNYVTNPVASRIPGFRESLFPRRDRWGEPATQTDFGPVQTRAVNPDPVNQALFELGVNKAQPQRTINGVMLSDQQYDDLSRISGRLAKTMLDNIVTPQFRQMPPGIQAQVINSVIDNAREYGHAIVMKDSLGGDNDVIAKGLELQMKRLQETPASPFRR